LRKRGAQLGEARGRGLEVGAAPAAAEQVSNDEALEIRPVLRPNPTALGVVVDERADARDGKAHGKDRAIS